MKIVCTLEVGDGLRRRIGQLIGNPRLGVDKTCDGRARRMAIVHFIQKQLAEANGEWSRLFPHPKLPPLDEHEATLAVDYLRKLGKSDEEIRRWLLLERARLRFPNSKIE